MKKQILTLVAIVLIAGFSNNLMAQETATATATATIVSPITIVKAVDMNFGNVAVQAATGGTVILVPAGTRTSTSGVTLPAIPGTVTAASFTIGGQGTYTFSVNLPEDGDIAIDDAGLGVAMAVDTFTSNGVAGTGDTTAALTGGAFTLNVGATLHVAAAQLAGVYTSTFDVIVNYN